MAIAKTEHTPIKSEKQIICYNIFKRLVNVLMDNIQLETIQKLYKSIQVLEAVLKANGGKRSRLLGILSEPLCCLHLITHIGYCICTIGTRLDGS